MLSGYSCVCLRAQLRASAQINASKLNTDKAPNTEAGVHTQVVKVAVCPMCWRGECGYINTALVFEHKVAIGSSNILA